MSHTNALIVGFWLGPFMAATISYLVMVQVISRRLRSHHPDVWDQLGRMTFASNSPANGWRFTKFFIFGSDYRKLNDDVLNRYALAERILFGLWAIGFLLGFVVWGSGIGVMHQ